MHHRKVFYVSFHLVKSNKEMEDKLAELYLFSYDSMATSILAGLTETVFLQQRLYQ